MRACGEGREHHKAYHGASNGSGSSSAAGREKGGARWLLRGSPLSPSPAAATVLAAVMADERGSSAGPLLDARAAFLSPPFSRGSAEGEGERIDLTLFTNLSVVVVLVVVAGPLPLPRCTREEPRCEVSSDSDAAAAAAVEVAEGITVGTVELLTPPRRSPGSDI